MKEALTTTKKLNGADNSISDAETDDETKPNIEHKLEDEAKDERLNDLVNEMLSLMIPLYAKNMNDKKIRITTQSISTNSALVHFTYPRLLYSNKHKQRVLVLDELPRQ